MPTSHITEQKTPQKSGLQANSQISIAQSIFHLVKCASCLSNSWFDLFSVIVVFVNYCSQVSIFSLFLFVLHELLGFLSAVVILWYLELDFSPPWVPRHDLAVVADPQDIPLKVPCHLRILRVFMVWGVPRHDLAVVADPEGIPL